MKTLTIRNLSKTYFDVHAGANVTAVCDLSLEVPAGEFVSIVGPSGCGKTTLLNMIAGFIPHTGGEILVGGLQNGGRGMCGRGDDDGVEVIGLVSGSDGPTIILRDQRLHGRRGA